MIQGRSLRWDGEESLRELTLAHNRRPFYPRHILCARPAYHILAFSTKCLLPVNCMFVY